MINSDILKQLQKFREKVYVKSNSTIQIVYTYQFCSNSEASNRNLGIEKDGHEILKNITKYYLWKVAVGCFSFFFLYLCISKFFLMSTVNTYRVHALLAHSYPVDSRQLSLLEVQYPGAQMVHTLRGKNMIRNGIDTSKYVGLGL